MSGATLSDRILNTSNDLINRFLAHPFVTEILLTGEAVNGKEYLTRDYKIYKETGDDWAKIFASGVTKAQSTEEKQLLQQLSGMVSDFVHRCETAVVAKFGDFDQRILSRVSAHDAFANYSEKVETFVSAPLLDLLVSFLGYFYVARLAADLKFDPRFKQNWYYEFYISDYNAAVGLVAALKTLIDIRGSSVSGEEERRLVDVFRMGFENQITLNDLKWSGKAI